MNILYKMRNNLLAMAVGMAWLPVANASNPIADSLLLLLQTGKPDTNRVKVLNELCWTNSTANRSLAFNYGQQALQLARQLNFAKGIAQSYNDLGILYFYESNFDKSIEYYNKALEVRQQLHDSMGMGACYIKIGISLQQAGHYRQAADAYLKCLPIYEKLNFEMGLGSLLNNIGILEYNMGNDVVSLQYQRRSIAIKLKIGDTRGLAGSYSNVANVYHRQLKDDSALHYYKQAVKVLEAGQIEQDLPVLYNNLCAMYVSQHNYRQAKEYGHKGLTLRRKLGEKKGISSSLSNLADIAITEKQYPTARAYLTEALNLAIETGALPERQQAYLILASYYEKTGNPQRGLDFFRRYAYLKDSIVNQDNFKAMEELRTRYETDKKEKDNLLLAQQNSLQALQLQEQNLLIYSLSGGLLLLLLVGWMAYNRYRLKQQKMKQALLLEQEKTRTKSILIGQEDERKRIAAELHDGIGQTLSAVRMNMEVLDVAKPDQKPLYNTVLKMIDDSCREIRNISHNMMPAILVKAGLVAAIREFAHHINTAGRLQVVVDTDSDDRLTAVAEINLYRVVQELVQNTLKYARATQIHIQLSRQGQHCTLMVEDNGTGFDKNLLATSAGNGWSNIYSRTNLLEGTVEIDTAPGRGTVVCIEIPLEALQEAA